MTIDEFKALLESKLVPLVKDLHHEEDTCYDCGFEDGVDAALGIVLEVITEHSLDPDFKP